MYDYDHNHPHAARAGAPTVQEAPFEERPCVCVKRHVPTSHVTQGHHVYPQGEQIKRWGKVRVHTIVDLCGSGHDNVHLMIRKVLAGEESFRIGNRYQQAVALEGARLIREGRESA